MRKILGKYVRRAALLVGFLFVAAAGSALGNDLVADFLAARDGDEWPSEYLKAIEDMPVNALGMPEHYQSQWQAAVSSSFDPDAISATLRQYYSDAMTEQDLAAMAALFASPLAQAVLAKEKLVKRYTAEDYQKFDAAYQDYEQSDPSRYQLYIELSKLQPTPPFDEFALILRAALLPFCDAQTAALQAEQVINEYRQRVDWENMTRTMMVFEDFSEDDMQQVISMFKSSAGRAMLAADSSLFSAVLQLGITELEQKFTELVRTVHS